MNFIGRNGVKLGFCSLKSGATAASIQQWGGTSVSREPIIAADPEVQAFVKTAKEMFPTEIPQGTTVARKISNQKLRMQAIYGSGYGGSFGIKVHVYPDEMAVAAISKKLGLSLIHI